MPSHLDRVRRIALSLPDATEKETWETPTFRVRDKIFVMGGHGRPVEISFKADPEERVALLEDPRFFVPAYVGSRGWIGMTLAGEVDWEEVRELVTTSYLRTAPRKLGRLVTPAEPA